MAIKIIFNRKKCIACNYCTIQNPEIWKNSNKDGKAELINGKETKGYFYLTSYVDDYDFNLKISENCPTKAIQIKIT